MPTIGSELGAEPSTSDSEADRDVSLDVDDSGHDEDGALEEDNSDLSEDDSDETPFLFQQQGQLVAVFYWDDCFLGQVTKIESATRSEVNFMERTTGNGQRQGFRWPLQEDRCSVQSDVVFAADISIEPCSSSGRAFCLVSLPDLEKYQKFKDSLL